MLFDTHCHLHDSEKFPDLNGEIEAAKEAGVEKMILVGVQPEEWERTVGLTKTHSELYAILGCHPNYSKDYSPKILQQLESLLGDAKCLALGEIGLDYHWDYSPRETQMKALLDQLDLAVRVSKPVVFHAREAYSDLLTVLENRPAHPYLFHCFVGSREDAKRAVALDCYFGIDGPITYKKSDELRSVIQSLPHDRLVLETDAPYLSPVPFRGKTNRSAYIPQINDALAALLEISSDQCANLTTANATKFFKGIS